MEELLKREAERIAELLKKDYDIIIKKTKENGVKILYYKPRNLARGEQ